MVQDIKPPSDYTSKCGNRNVKGVDVTVDGKEDKKQLTQFGEWPNMCAISTLVSRNLKNIFNSLYIMIKKVIKSYKISSINSLITRLHFYRMLVVEGMSI